MYLCTYIYRYINVYTCICWHANWTTPYAIVHTDVFHLPKLSLEVLGYFLPMCVEASDITEVSDLWPTSQIWPAAYFVNKVLLEHSEACSLICSLWLFSHTTMAGLSSHSKKHMAHQEWNIYHLAIYRKSWPTPTLPIEPAFLRFPDDNITGVC